CPSGQACSHGVCQTTCQQGLTNCNGNCVNLKTDRANCESCSSQQFSTACHPGEVCSNGVCQLQCQVGLNQCGNLCVDLQTNNQHCGNCSTTASPTACKPGEVCSGGKCVTSCQTGQTNCNGTCVNTNTDRFHCGKCGTTCGPGTICIRGACQLQCQPGLTNCNGTCSNLSNDRNHCGLCGIACPSGEVCSQGKCQLSCQGRMTQCTVPSGELVCTDLLHDNQNCAKCGNACPQGFLCSNGVCRLSCQSGLSVCHGTCVDLQTNNLHCGTCGNSCPSGQVCSQGTCNVSCVAGQTNCGGHCVDLTNNARHCGVCANACPLGQVCDQGQCSAQCTSVEVNCGGSCVDTTSNRVHCGACNKACTSGYVCVGGTCQLSCQSGLQNCGGTCTDVQSSRLHCGACNNACPSGQACVQGKCQTTCPTDSANCNGACVNLTNNPQHCGRCGNVCKNGQTCSSGVCTCPADQVLCGGSCISTAYNPQHCGSCGSPCTINELCINGVCTSPCSKGNALCNGVCTDVQSNLIHCGACGNACPKGQVCSQGQCGCPQGQALCAGSTCIDTQSNNSHCGGCNNACGSNQVCSKGVCKAQCGPGELDCNGACINVQNDPQNCGACNNVCNPGTGCSNGSCSAWAQGLSSWSSSGNVQALATASDASNNVYIAGSYKGRITIGQTTFSNRGTFESFVAKYDNTGKVLWANNIQSSDLTLIHAMTVSGTSTYVVGTTRSDTQFGSIPLGNTGQINSFVAKLDGQGKWLWAKVLLRDPGVSSSTRVRSDSAGNVYVTGSCSTGLTLGANGALQDTSVRDSHFVAQLNPQGTIQWVKTAQASSPGHRNVVRGLAVSSQGDVYVGGDFTQDMILDSTTLAAQATNKAKHLFVYKLNNQGAYQWASAGAPQAFVDVAAMALDSSNNVYITGTFSGTLSIANTIFTSAGGKNLYVLKLSSAGAPTSLQQLGNRVPTSARDITVDSQGNAYVTGGFSGQNLVVGGTTLSVTNGRYGSFVAHLTSQGTWGWAQLLGIPNTSSAGEFRGLSAGANNEVFFMGVVRSETTLGNTTFKNNGGTSAILGKFSSQGAVSWSSQINGEDVGEVVVQGTNTDSNDNIYVKGSFKGTATFGTFTLTASNKTRGDSFVGKLNSKGAWQWVQTYTNGQVFQEQDPAVDSQGNVYISGLYYTSLTAGTTTLQPASGSSNSMFLAKLNTSGQWQWAKSLGTGNFEQINKMALDSSGNVILLGQFPTTTSFDSLTLNSANGGNLFMAKVDGTGKAVWLKGLGTSLKVFPRDIATDSNDNIVIAGFFVSNQPFANTTLTAQGAQENLFVARYTKDGAFQWVRTATSATGRHLLHKVSINAQGTAYVAGVYNATFSLGSTTLQTATGGTESHLFVAEIDSAGTWKRAASAGVGLRSLEVVGLEHTSQGDLYLACNVAGGVFFNTSTADTSVSTQNTFGFVVKLDSSLKYSGQRVLSSSLPTQIHEVTQDTQGNLTFVGRFYNDLAFTTIPLTGFGISAYIGQLPPF
ncbi:MAG: hypothetical protein EP343_22030, partial [Deltaproteobacteria bacterium]